MDDADATREAISFANGEDDFDTPSPIMCICVYFLSAIKSRALHYTIMLIYNSLTTRSSSNLTIFFLISRRRCLRTNKTQNLLSLTLSPPACVFRLFSTIGTKRQTEYVRACVLSLGVFPLLCVLLKRAQSASFFSLLLCFVAKIRV